MDIDELALQQLLNEAKKFNDRSAQFGYCSYLESERCTRDFRIVSMLCMIGGEQVCRSKLPSVM
jgi:hypothetical protein